MSQGIGQTASGIRLLCLLAGVFVLGTAPAIAADRPETLDAANATPASDAGVQTGNLDKPGITDMGAIVAQAIPTTTPADSSAATPSLDTLYTYGSEGKPGSDNASPLAQVTSVSQLSDVKPTDWAFQALQSLVEKYGCLVGYPDRTFRGKRALTRYEFAAGLNACMDRMSELLAAATADLVKKEDLVALQKMQEEFAAELATLRGRVDVLEAKTAQLESQQFSTTTKLQGEVVFSLAGASGAYSGSTFPAALAGAGFTGSSALPATGLDLTAVNTTGGAVNLLAPANAGTLNLALTNANGGTPNVLSNTYGAAGRDSEVAFNNRVRLNFLTSFTGKDLLITGIQAHNFANDPGSFQGALGYSDPGGGFNSNFVQLNASTVRLGYEPQFGSSNPSTGGSVTQPATFGANAASLYKLLYIFPVTAKLTAFAGSNAETSDAFPAITPWASDSQGAISRFAGYNAAVRVSGGTSGIGLASAVGLIWNPIPQVDVRALYGSVNGAIPSDLGLAGNTPLGAGFFGGSTVAAAQITAKPVNGLTIGFNYANSYHQINILGTGLAASDIGAILGTSRNLAAIPAGSGYSVNQLITDIANEPISMDSIGTTITWRFHPKIALSVSGAAIFAKLQRVDASATFTSWQAGLAFYDVIKQGDLAGILFGQPLYRDSVGGSQNLQVLLPALRENATPFHVEAFYKFKLTDNISVTPGMFAVFNPEGYSGNPTALVGVVRTTFTF